MPLTMVITRDVEDRYRGFLGSLMLELAPGVYAQPRMSAGVRARVLDVIADWHGRLNRGSIVVCWGETTAYGGQSVCFPLNNAKARLRLSACWHGCFRPRRHDLSRRKRLIMTVRFRFWGTPEARLMAISGWEPVIRRRRNRNRPVLDGRHDCDGQTLCEAGRQPCRRRTR